MRAVRRAGLVIGCVVVGSGAHAQGRQLGLGANARVEYITNLAGTRSQLSQARALNRGDTRFSPAATIDASLPFGRQSLTIVGSAGYDFYARNSRLNSERIGLNANAGLVFSRCTGGLTANYQRRQSDLGDIVLVRPDGSVDGRVRNIEDIKTIGATLSCGPLVGLRPTASVSQSWIDNSSDIRAFGSSRTTTVSGGLGYTRPRLGTITAFGSYSKTRYPDRDILIPGGSGFEAQTAGVRFEREIGSRLTGLVELGYTSVQPDEPGVEKFKGSSWRVQLTAAVNDRLQVGVNGSRGVQAPNRVAANFSIETEIGANATYELTPRLSANASASYRTRDFRGVGSFLGPVTGPVLGRQLTDDKLYQVGGGLSFVASRRLTVGVDGRYERRSANGTLFDYNAARFGLTASTRF